MAAPAPTVEHLGPLLASLGSPREDSDRREGFVLLSGPPLSKDCQCQVRALSPFSAHLAEGIIDEARVGPFRPHSVNYIVDTIDQKSQGGQGLLGLNVRVHENKSM